MTAGIPGVGIGGIFYLASALLMPMRSLASVLRGKPEDARWSLALRQAAIAGGILAALWATGLALGWIITSFIPHGSTMVAGAAGGNEVRSVVKTGALILSLGTLAIVLAFVQLLRLVLPPRPTPASDPMMPRARTRPAA